MPPAPPNETTALTAAYREEMGRLVTATLAAYDSEDDPVSGLRAGLGTLLRLLAEQPATARLCFVDVLAAGSAALAARDEALQRLSRMFDVVEGHLGGPPPTLVGLALAGGLSEVIYRQIVAGRTASLQEELPDLLYMTVLPLHGAEAARAAIEET